MPKTFRIIDGLKTNTTYYFQIRAKNVVGVWSDLPTAVSLTTSRDTTAPSSPTNFTLTTSNNLFLFNWSQVTNVDMRGGGYRLYVNTSNDSGNSKLIKEVGYTTEWAVVAVGEKTNDNSITISAGTTYWWWLTAIDASGNETSRVASSPASGSLSSSFPPASHASSHQDGGSDEINVAGLNGELADLQKVKDHSHQSSGGGVGGQLDHGLALTGLDDDDHTQYQLRSEKDNASGYAGLNSSTRVTKGIDTMDDVIVDSDSKGLVLKDNASTPHYWRITIDSTGSLVITDLGTSKP